MDTPAFRIVVDTREQEPWTFDSPTVRRKLDSGDYSVEGLESSLSVERKSLNDAVSTILHSRPRFERELERLRSCRWACVVVEADMDRMARGMDMHVRVSPESFIAACAEISVRTGIPIYWCGSRQAARTFAQAFLRAAYLQHYREGENE